LRHPGRGRHRRRPRAAQGVRVGPDVSPPPVYPFASQGISGRNDDARRAGGMTAMRMLLCALALLVAVPVVPAAADPGDVEYQFVRSASPQGEPNGVRLTKKIPFTIHLRRQAPLHLSGADRGTIEALLQT